MCQAGRSSSASASPCRSLRSSSSGSTCAGEASGSGSAGKRRPASHLRSVCHDMFFLPLPAEEKVLRAVLVYAFLVIALRLVGKRELGQFNTLDLIVLLLVANAVQNGIIGAENSVTGAFIGAATLFVVNEAVNRVTYVFPGVSRLLEGNPTFLIEKGKPV